MNNQRLLCVLLTVLLMQSPQNAVCSSKAETPLKASLIIVSPGTAIYSSLGHCALRLQSPDNGLDYCFTYEANADEGIADYVRFFSAKTQAHWVAVATSTYFHDYAAEHRSLTEYPLPLQQKEIQQLWRNLDESITSDYTDRFDFITNNCTQGLLRMLAQSVDRQLNLTEPSRLATLDNGDLARLVTHRSAWMQFLVITLLGSQADGHWDVFNRATPEYLAVMMNLKADNSSSEYDESDGNQDYTGGPLSPMAVFFAVICLLSRFVSIGL